MKAATGLVLAEGTLVEPQLQQERQRPAHLGPRGNPQLGHDRVAVEIGSDGGELLLVAQLRDAGLQLVHAPAQLLGPAPDRKSTRLNSSHSQISYAVFC